MLNLRFQKYFIQAIVLNGSLNLALPDNLKNDHQRTQYEDKLLFPTSTPTYLAIHLILDLDS
jgi:hypothetical protein